MCDRNQRSLFGFGHDSQPLVGVELVHVLCFAKSPPHFLHDLHLFERRVQRIGGGPYGIHHSVPRIIRGNPCVLAGSARRLSSVPQPLSFLSDCFEGLAMKGTSRDSSASRLNGSASFLPASADMRSSPNPGDLGIVTALVESPTARVPTVPHDGCPQPDTTFVREGSTFGEPWEIATGLPAAHWRKSLRESPSSTRPLTRESVGCPVSRSAQRAFAPLAYAHGDRRGSSCHEMNSFRNHCHPLLAVFDAALATSHRRRLTSASALLKGSCASSSLGSHNCRPNSTWCWGRSDVRLMDLRCDECSAERATVTLDHPARRGHASPPGLL
jgi:hypothetical protein